MNAHYLFICLFPKTLLFKQNNQSLDHSMQPWWDSSGWWYSVLLTGFTRLYSSSTSLSTVLQQHTQASVWTLCSVKEKFLCTVHRLLRLLKDYCIFRSCIWESFTAPHLSKHGAYITLSVCLCAGIQVRVCSHARDPPHQVLGKSSSVALHDIVQ